MTFQALFKRWCTAKSFCLIRSHFEKWADSVGCGFYFLRAQIQYEALCPIFLSIRGNTDVTWSVGVSLKWMMAFSSSLLRVHSWTLSLKIICKCLWEWGRNAAKSGLALLNTWIKDSLHVLAGPAYGTGHIGGRLGRQHPAGRPLKKKKKRWAPKKEIHLSPL